MSERRRQNSSRFSLEEVIAEVQNDSDSGDSDLYSSSDTDENDNDSFASSFVQNENQENGWGNDLNSSRESPPEIDSDSDYEPENLSKRTRTIESSDDSDSNTIANTPQVTRGRGRGRRGVPRGRRARTRGRAPSRGNGRGMANRNLARPIINNWTDADAHPPNNTPFLGNPGLKVDSTSFEPVDYVELFFNDDLINHLCIQTNLYAEQYIQSNNLKQFSRVHDWVPVTNDEVKCFLGIVMLMGLVKLPTIELYWSRKVMYNLPVFNHLMTRNRFQLILKFLHFNDNSNLPERTDPLYDRLYKIRPVIDHLFEMFQSVYEPRQDVCVDESLLLWKGRLLFRQFIPLKRARFGIKIYLCCESDGDMRGSGGYCYRFKVYAGKDDPVNEIRPVLPADSNHLSTSEQMVVYLTLPLLGKGYHIYTDNWYSSLRLFLYLRENQTLACGTVRANRGIPPQLVTTNLQNTGDSCAILGDNQIVATKYHSTKMVYLLSTIHGHEDVTVRNRRRDGTIKRPKVSAEYNKNMGGVDKQDQLIQPYDCTRKSMKWTKKLFFHFLHVSVCNSFILASRDGYDKPFLAFIESVIGSWIFKDDPVPMPTESEDIVRLRDRHFPALIPPNPGKERPTRLCKVCSKKGLKRKECRNYCPDCPSAPALCYPDCYRAYHTTLAYWK